MPKKRVIITPRKKTDLLRKRRADRLADAERPAPPAVNVAATSEFRERLIDEILSVGLEEWLDRER